MSADEVVALPVRLVSVANLREHWAAKAKRARLQREAARVLVARVVPAGAGAWPVRITITRIAPRALDGDNMQGACKAVRDGIADALGYRDDSHPDLTWAYAQAKGKAGCTVALEWAL